MVAQGRFSCDPPNRKDALTDMPPCSLQAGGVSVMRIIRAPSLPQLPP